MTEQPVWKQIIPYAVGGLVTLMIVLSVLYVTRTIPSYGVIKAVNLGVYSDVGCQNVITEINWGMLEPNVVINYTCYVKNLSNVPLNVTVTSSNWNPATAPQYIFFSADVSECQNIPVNGVREIVFTLQIAYNVTGITNFSFNINIVGSG